MCRFVALVLFLLWCCALQPTCAQDTANCANIASCIDCLTETDCGAWSPTLQECFSSCSVIYSTSANTSCFTNETFPSGNPQEACEVAASFAPSDKVCTGQTNCRDCINTALPASTTNASSTTTTTNTTTASGITTCQWFPQNGGYCASACDLNGCGETSCPQSSSCKTLGSSCQDCISGDCAWSIDPEVACVDNCNDTESIADTSSSCFNTTTYSNTSVAETCQIASNQEVNAVTCSNITTCGECVTTSLLLPDNGNSNTNNSSSNVTSCQWFTNGGYCASGCNSDNITDCGTALTSCQSLCEGLSCNACFNGSICAYAPSIGCVQSCDITILANTTCYLTSDNDASQVCGDGEPTSSPTLSPSSAAAAAAAGIMRVVLLSFTVMLVSAMGVS